ncbi:MAG: ABC transporter permease [Bacteroidetes bacterium]|nr:ABC transporter permease [Bacteroidota bacterium]
MIRNYFKIAWRNLRNNKVYSFINIAGLATGMAVALLIGLWIWDEVSFDSYYPNHKKLAQVLTYQTMKDGSGSSKSISMPLGVALKNEYSDIFKRVSLASWNDEQLLLYGDKKIPGNGMWVQEDFPAMFGLKMLKGNEGALKDPSAVLIDESMAKAIFNDEDPINKVVKVGDKFNMKIAGVYKDLPRNTNFYDTKVLLAWGNKENWRNTQTEWENHCGQLFVELNDGVTMRTADAKIRNVPTSKIEEWKEEAIVYPMDRLHLYGGEFENGKEREGRIQFVWLFGIIGAFVLLLACINFMNLSTARSEKRAKEVGIRKTIGSVKSQLIGQFLCESILVAVLAFILSLALVELSLEFFNQLSDKEMSIPFSNIIFWLLTLGFTFFTGLIAGSYPAFYLSSFEPIKVLKGTLRAGPLASLPRKVLVVLQFTVSVTLIIGTIIVYRQIQYAKNRPVGYNRDGLITVGMGSPDLWGKFEPIRNDLLATGVVANMAESSYPTTNFGQNNGMQWRGQDPSRVIFFRDVNVTHDFGKTVGWQILRGRDFSKDFATDSSAMILNEATAKILGFKNPLGEIVKFRGKPFTVIGVVKDMVTESPYEPIDPAIFVCEGWMSVINIKLKPNAPVHDALAKIENVFKKFSPNYPFSYHFTDTVYDTKFSAEMRIGNLATFFAILAIFISCLGLFGLASFVAEQRTKEIGVRKVLGASVFNLWKLLSKEFIALVLISCLIAVPLSSFFLNKWLMNYNYRTDISWWIFVISGFGAMIITLLTVSYQAIKAALMNPVKSLRSE